MGKVIISVGLLVCIIITICNFWEDDIIYLYKKTMMDYKYKDNISTNDYYLEDNFLYFDNFTNIEINNKQELINSIYYSINSGQSETSKYCGKDYVGCNKDINDIFNNGQLLTLINNFVHPFNNYQNITSSMEYDKFISIKIERIYSENEINQIEDIVDNIIENNLTDDMTDREKIKVIHDYIINNTKYDEAKEEGKSAYKSTTAYGVLIEGYGICSGYADAMVIFLNKLGIINYKMDNDVHAWNLVYLDNEWLHLDLTWDDPVSNTKEDILSHDYFLLTSEELKKIDDEFHYYDENIFLEA